MRVATKNYTPSHNNKTYRESHVETSMDSAYLNQQQAQVVHGGRKHPLVDEEESSKSQLLGAGYSVKRGVINLELGPEVPPPSFTEAQLDEHIVGGGF